MAYFDRTEEFLVWMAEPLPDDVLTASHIHLMEPADQEIDVTDPEPACGYIIQDWFGPFLFAPGLRGLRGNC